MGIENYTMAKVMRSSFHMADYNPRIIKDDARQRLRESVRRYGFVQPPIVNKRTMTVVSGHQRLSIADEINGYPGKDYEVEVAFIDVSEKDEKQLNVLLNNVSSMGEFDVDALSDLVLDSDLDIESLGFSDADLDVLFSNDSRYLQMFSDAPVVTEDKGILDDIKQDRSKMVDRQKEDNSAAYYFTVVCDSSDEKAKLLTKMGCQDYEEVVPASSLYRLANADFSDMLKIGTHEPSRSK